ncbi:hypothetical protein SK224_04105 [Microbacterium sp. BG28]|uniref:hypothetical protein n=1 Tax=Microbacterium sp. BG28 TaxID=3097356 RepID=UPI002A5AA12A|nr:hypothetical protein [Microbacterium sp. BG28]MDY0828305.1 hypothetical protein [Microbacterium sp. BG28]
MPDGNVDWDFWAQIATVIAAFAVPIAVLALVLEMRRTAVAQAARVVAWTVVPHDRIRSAGVRGIVIVNESEQVARDVRIDVHAEGTDAVTAVYPIVPPGAHFLTLQERQTSDAAGEAPWVGDGNDYVLLPVNQKDGALTISLRHAQTSPGDEMREYELLPWTQAGARADSSFAAAVFEYSLGNTRWRRRSDLSIRRRRPARTRAWQLWRPRLAGQPEVGERRFPEVSLNSEQARLVIADTEDTYQQSRTLMDAVGQRLAGGIDPAESKPVVDPRLRGAGIVEMRRTRESTRQGEVGRGALAFEFSYAPAGGEAVAAYSFGASQYGDVPAWFGRKTAKGAESVSFKKRGWHPKRRKASDWPADGAELATAIVDAIVEDLREHAPSITAAAPADAR